MNDNLKAADLLDKAAELIAQPGAWTQDVEARGPDGARCLPSDAAACAWSAVGAVLHVGNCDTYNLAAAIIALEDLTGRNPFAWNNHPARRQDDVVRLLKRGAANLRATP